MLNEADIQRIIRCDLADKETIEGFAPEIPEQHALILSAKNGITRTFPLIFQVRDFGHPPSGVHESVSQLSKSSSMDTKTHLDME